MDGKNAIKQLNSIVEVEISKTDSVEEGISEGLPWQSSG